MTCAVARNLRLVLIALMLAVPGPVIAAGGASLPPSARAAALATGDKMPIQPRKCAERCWD